MDYHYRAFISYRHSPEDIKVASDVQKRLEHYRIPRDLQKKLGIKRLGRVFRDKDELSIASDLNDTIKAALDSTEFLIVICSTRSIQSIWVQKEIEYFLDKHDRRHILTVLVDGEPYDVIPSILCEETVTTKTESGEEVEVKVPLEPLSCDYRFGFRKAHREELPRLVAGILGCSYDALRQRQKKYQMRLLSAAALGLAALSGYFLWSNINIQKNYSQSLINQSRYLASSSMQQLENSNRLLAAQLALAALPGKEQDRPLIPEARYALTEALSAYTAPRALNFSVVNRFVSDQSNIYDYIVHPNGCYVAMLDGLYQLNIWDTENGETIQKYTFDSIQNYLHLYDESSFLLVSGTDLSCYAWESGELLWTQKYLNNINEISILPGSSNPDLLLTVGNAILHIEGQTQNVLDRQDMADYVDVSQEFSLYTSKSTQFFQENNGVLYHLCTDEADLGHILGIVKYTVSTHQMEWLPLEYAFSSQLSFYVSDTGRIYLSGIPTGQSFPSNILWKIDGLSIFNGRYAPGQEQVVCLDAESGQLLWKHELTFTGETSVSRFGLDIRTTNESFGEIRELLIVTTSEVCELLDPETGELIRRYEFPTEAASILEENSRSFLDAILVDGTLVSVNLKDESYQVMAGMIPKIVHATRIPSSRSSDQKTSFFLSSENILYMYKTTQGDEDWISIEGEYPLDQLLGNFSFSGKYLAVHVSNRLYMYDMEEKRQLWMLEDEEKLGSLTHMQGFSEDGSFLYITNEYYGTQMCPIRISSAEGTIEEVPMFSQKMIEDTYWRLSSSYILRQGKLYVMAQHNVALSSNAYYQYLCCYSPEEDVLQRIALPTTDIHDDVELLLNDSGTRAIVMANDGSGYQISLETGEVSKLKNQLPLFRDAIWEEEKKQLAFWEDTTNSIHICQEDGTEISVIDCGIKPYASMQFWEDELLVLCQNGELYRYEIPSGEMLECLTVNTITESYAYKTVDWHFSENQELFLRMGTTMSILDTKEWSMLAYIPCSYGYLPSLNVISIPDISDTKSLGYCPYYDLDTLMEKGRKFVGNAVLSDEQRFAYGLE